MFRNRNLFDTTTINQLHIKKMDDDGIYDEFDNESCTTFSKSRFIYYRFIYFFHK